MDHDEGLVEFLRFLCRMVQALTAFSASILCMIAVWLAGTCGSGADLFGVSLVALPFAGMFAALGWDATQDLMKGE